MNHSMTTDFEEQPLAKPVGLLKSTFQARSFQQKVLKKFRFRVDPPPSHLVTHCPNERSFP